MMSMSIRDRLLLRAQLEPSGCWLWTGTVFRDTGYGQITYDKKVQSVHRLSLHVFRGFSLDPKIMVLHLCDVKRCYNPKHLYLGDHAANTRDAHLRKRFKSGAHHPMAKLDEAKVIKIRKLIAAGHSYSGIAKKFGVDSSLIGLIKRRKAWACVKGE